MASSQPSLGDLDGALLERILSRVHAAVPHSQRAAHDIQFVNWSCHAVWHRLCWKLLRITRAAVTALLKAEGGWHRAAVWQALRRRALVASTVQIWCNDSVVDSLLLRILQHINSPSLEELGLYGVADSSEHLFSAVAACASLHRLSLYFTGSAAACTVASSSIARLCSLSALRNLSLTAPGFSGGLPRSLSKLSKLRGLELGGGGNLGHAPAALSRLTALASLRLIGVGFALPPVVAAACTTLSSLTLRPASAAGCSGRLLAELPLLSLHRLEYYQPAGEAAVPEAIFASSATKVSLSIRGTLKALPALDTASPLRSLTLSMSSTGELSAVPTSWCRCLSALTELWLADMDLQHAAWTEALKDLRALQELTVIGASGSELPMGLLQPPCLTALYLLEMSQPQFPSGADLSRLAELSMSCCSLADVPPCLATATSLTRLDLSYNPRLRLSHRGVAVLAGLSNLRELDLADDTRYEYSDGEDDPEPWLWQAEHLEPLMEVLDANPRLRIKVDGAGG